MNRFLACSLLLALAACGGDDAETPTGPTGEITIEELTVGTGATAVVGDVVTVHYTLFLANGTRARELATTPGSRSPFQIGAGRVIPGFERGVLGMRVGGKRRVTIPPDLAYGSTGQGPIPPNATIRFEIELVSIAGK